MSTTPQRNWAHTHKMTIFDVASDMKMSTAQQRERSDTHKMTRGLCEHMSQSPSAACTRKKWQLETWKRCFTWGSLEYRTCHQKWAWGIWSLAPATQMIIILVMYQIVSCTLLPNETTRLSSLSKHDPTVQFHLILRLPQKPPLVATRACQSFSNVHEIPRLPRGWKGVWCLALATQSEVRTSGEKWPGKRNVISPKHDGRRQARTHLRKRCLEADVSWKVCFKNGRSRNFSPCKGRHQIN